MLVSRRRLPCHGDAGVENKTGRCVMYPPSTSGHAFTAPTCMLVAFANYPKAMKAFTTQIVPVYGVAGSTHKKKLV